MAGAERVRYKNISKEELEGLSRPDQVIRVYLHDSHEEFRQELSERGSSFPLVDVDKIVEQDMVAGMRLYLEELRKNTT